jgi:hypothetical protein
MALAAGRMLGKSELRRFDQAARRSREAAETPPKAGSNSGHIDVYPED